MAKTGVKDFAPGVDSAPALAVANVVAVWTEIAEILDRCADAATGV